MFCSIFPSALVATVFSWPTAPPMQRCWALCQGSGFGFKFPFGSSVSPKSFLHFRYEFYLEVWSPGSLCFFGFNRAKENFEQEPFFRFH